MATFILIPGGWQGAWVYQTLADILTADGHRGLPISLAGLGDTQRRSRCGALTNRGRRRLTEPGRKRPDRMRPAARIHVLNRGIPSKTDGHGPEKVADIQVTRICPRYCAARISPGSMKCRRVSFRYQIGTHLLPANESGG